MSGKKTSPDDLLSTLEAAAELGITRGRLNVLLNAGRVPAIRIGPTWAICRADLEVVRVRKQGRPHKKPGDKKSPYTPRRKKSSKLDEKKKKS